MTAISSGQIKSLAASLGFDACGIVRIDSRPPFPEENEKLAAWVEKGRHGTMKYLEDFESRAEKFWKDFPGAKSIIVVGVNYYSDQAVIARSEATKQSQNSEIASPATELWRARNDWPRGRVARYAWGRDYHRVIGKKLEEFREALSKVAARPLKAEICVDTKPLSERSLAQKAGLGFIGKQSQLLNPKFGPWLFLAELVTDLELEPDLPYIGSCGACRICIEECPTQAIKEDNQIDARRCIAYLTIEHKGEIAEDLKPFIQDWVFGCDICLQVCPYAAKGKETSWTELKGESGFGPYLDLAELAKISSNGAYERKFEGTAILRAHRKQLLRNAAIVIGNRHSEPREAGRRISDPSALSATKRWRTRPDGPALSFGGRASG